MGRFRCHSWLQQNGTPKLPVETLFCQSAVQGGCTRHQGRWRYIDTGFSEGDTEAFVLLFTGERHVPSRLVRSPVRCPSGHHWQLQVQKQRPISCSVILLQGKSSMLLTLLASLLTFMNVDIAVIIAQISNMHTKTVKNKTKKKNQSARLIVRWCFVPFNYS